MTNPTCPTCGRADWPEGPRFNGHKSYCKQHPETWPKKQEQPSKPSSPSPSSSQPSSSSATPSSSTSSSTLHLEPVEFSFKEGERLPSQQEIPEFKSPEQQAKEAKEGKSETPEATKAEERKAGVSAIAALIVPLFDMVNRVAVGEPALPGDSKSFALTKDDAEMLAQAVILVDNKYGGPLSKSLGGDYGPELFLAGVSLGLGIKITMMFRLRAQRARTRPSAAPSSEEIPREKSPLEKAGDSLRNLITPQKKEKKEPEEEKPEGAMSGDKFMEYAAEYQKDSIVH